MKKRYRLRPWASDFLIALILLGFVLLIALGLWTWLTEPTGYGMYDITEKVLVNLIN